MSVQGKFEVSINSLHVCMNSSCVCKWFEIAKSSKLIKIFPLQIHILGLFCILSFEERKRSSSRLSFWPQKVFTVSTAFPFQGNDISTSTLQTLSLILKQSSMLTDMPVITWHAFSEFVPDLSGLWPPLMLGKIFHQSRTAQPTAPKKMNSSKPSPAPLWAACPCQSLRHHEEHIQTLRELQKFKLISSLYKNKPKAADVTQQLSHRTRGDVTESPSSSSYTETWSSIPKPFLWHGSLAPFSKINDKEIISCPMIMVTSKLLS